VSFGSSASISNDPSFLSTSHYVLGSVSMQESGGGLEESRDETPWFSCETGVCGMGTRNATPIACVSCSS